MRIRSTYWCNVVEELAQKTDNIVNVLVTLNEPKAFAPSQVSNDIEGKELQPLTEVAALTSAGEHFLGLVEPVSERRVDERLVVDQRAHGERIVHTATVLSMEVFVSGREEGQKRLAVRDSALDWVEARLTHH